MEGNNNNEEGNSEKEDETLKNKPKHSQEEQRNTEIKEEGNFLWKNMNGTLKKWGNKHGIKRRRKRFIKK